MAATTQVVKLNEGGALQTVDTARQLLERMEGEFSKVLPSNLTPARFVRIAITSVSRVPKLLECDRASFLNAIMKCAEIGIEPDTVLGLAHLIPFDRKVQLVLGYKGMLLLAREHGELKSIYAETVHEGDIFRVTKGDDPRIVHEFDLNQRDGKSRSHRPITHVYAIAKLASGEMESEIMDREQVEEVRRSSKAAQSGPWTQWWGEMARKTVLRRLCKKLRMSPIFREAERIDNEEYELDQAPGVRRTTPLQSLADALGDSIPVVDESPTKKRRPAPQADPTPEAPPGIGEEAPEVLMGGMVQPVPPPERGKLLAAIAATADGLRAFGDDPLKYIPPSHATWDEFKLQDLLNYLDDKLAERAKKK